MNDNRDNDNINRDDDDDFNEFSSPPPLFLLRTRCTRGFLCIFINRSSQKTTLVVLRSIMVADNTRCYKPCPLCVQGVQLFA